MKTQPFRFQTKKIGSNSSQVDCGQLENDILELKNKVKDLEERAFVFYVSGLPPPNNFRIDAQWCLTSNGVYRRVLGHWLPFFTN